MALNIDRQETCSGLLKIPHPKIGKAMEVELFSLAISRLRITQSNMSPSFLAVGWAEPNIGGTQ